MKSAAEQPMTFDAAGRWLRSRVNVLTKMNAAGLALSRNLPPKAKALSFFSAKVQHARILDGLREEADRFARGETDLATARMNLKLFLAGSGYGYAPDDVAKSGTPPPGVSEEDWKKRKSLVNLASTARLNLLLNQNARMAHAVGQREVSMDPDIRERWPYFRYHAEKDERSRNSHRALDGLVLPKNDPFWNTHTPPWDYNCRCDIEDCDSAEAEENGGPGKAVVTDNPDGTQSARLEINGRSVYSGPAPSGYVFDVHEAFEVCDMSRIHNLPMRRVIFAKLTEFVRKTEGVQLKLRPGKAAADYVPVTGSPGTVKAFIAGRAAEFAETGKFPDGEILVGEFNRKLSDALGIDGGAAIFLGKGSSGFGFDHMKKRHASELADGSAARALEETVYSKNTSVKIYLAGNKAFCAIGNPVTGAFTSLIRYGAGWDKWQVVSAHYPGEGYAEDKEVMNE